MYTVRVGLGTIFPDPNVQIYLEELPALELLYRRFLSLEAWRATQPTGRLIQHLFGFYSKICMNR
jgi:hypothetical protein